LASALGKCMPAARQARACDGLAAVACRARSAPCMRAIAVGICAGLFPRRVGVRAGMSTHHSQVPQASAKNDPAAAQVATKPPAGATSVYTLVH
jgi:hypothetical protein